MSDESAHSLFASHLPLPTAKEEDIADVDDENNDRGAESCVQCGGDLAVSGKRVADWTLWKR